MLTKRISYIFVDTNIWHYAYITPKQNELFELHKISKDFLRDLLLSENIKICMTVYQIGEILEIFRKDGMSKDLRIKILENFYTEKFLLKELTAEEVRICENRSINSNIHIYDYLAVFPLKGMISKIYSADDHFQHKDFKEIAEVENPIHPWILREGRKPQKI